MLLLLTVSAFADTPSYPDTTVRVEDPVVDDSAPSAPPAARNDAPLPPPYARNWEVVHQRAKRESVTGEICAMAGPPVAAAGFIFAYAYAVGGSPEAAMIASRLGSSAPAPRPPGSRCRPVAR